MAIKVHGDVISSTTQRVLACLNETGLNCELVPVRLALREQKEPFLSLNPFGQIPGFEDADLKLFESRAITQYIAHSYSDNGNQLIVHDQKKMAIVSAWTEVEAQQFEPTSSKLVYELVVKPTFYGMASDETVVSKFKGKLAKILDIYEARLGQSRYLGGDDFSLADLHHLPNGD